jgi:hypothetical protein
MLASTEAIPHAAAMSAIQPLLPPAGDGEEVSVYVANPRAKKSFNTVLDAAQLFDANGRSVVKTTAVRDGAERRVLIETKHALRGGTISETFELSANPRLAATRFHRVLVDAEGVTSREERIDFGRGPFRLPEATYPEVMLPFVLRWQPFDAERRSLHAWIVDRFVARVYCEWRGRHEITVPAGRIETVEMMMYPDLNDWVNLGSMINTLAKPLLPKYRMWFEAAAPHRVVRFEGPYGPPGAPEIVLELASLS